MKIKNKHQRWNDDACDNFEKIHRKRTNDHHRRNGKIARAIEERNNEFKCTNCGVMVSLNREVSGVNNRNHCPYCLWSRHLDQRKAGDRLSTCRGRMEPLGLTVKHTLKRYQAEKASRIEPAKATASESRTGAAQKALRVNTAAQAAPSGSSMATRSLRPL